MKPKLITNKTTEQVSGEYLSAEREKTISEVLQKINPNV